ncbi:uncharacterized protein LOC135810270 [Sycon ciliatum]|uniref:uncharacterized protein LOC135810270 n=1 Tax=Sycon ciliatum TaxID=27933 RepID=UPI0031F677E1
MMAASPSTPRVPSRSDSGQLVLPPIHGGTQRQLAKPAGASPLRNHATSGTASNGGNPMVALDTVPRELLATLARHQRPTAMATSSAAVTTAGGTGAGDRSRLGKKQHTSLAATRSRPAAAWNFPAQRARFKHLTEQPVCFCGAGKDVSFIYDASVPKADGTKPAKATLALQDCGKQGAESKTLIPDDYHLCKTTGVLGIDIMDSDHTTKLQEHPHHSLAFPSLHPAGRQQVLALKETMATMLKQAAIDDEIQMNGPTQVHNLLELTRKEQDIYNVCFHEVIRQVSVECVERGQILADIRDRYTKLLARIPGQVLSLHEELLAQRSLDRQLACELQKFESEVAFLSEKLKDVNTHDKFVQQEADSIKAELAHALAESQKNAHLLTEYHELYELQRRRLENEQAKLLTEKDLWQKAAYSLALKVTDEQCLQTCRRLQLCERCWFKLAMRFAIMLSDHDMGEIRTLLEHVHIWQAKITAICRQIDRQDDLYDNKMREVISSMQHWALQLSANVVKGDGLVEPPDQEFCKRLLVDTRKWEMAVGQLAERYSGDNVVEGEASLDELRQCMSSWTDIAMRLYNRHSSEEEEHKDKATLKEINGMVTEFHSRLYVRVSGENGVAEKVVKLTNPLEAWATKIDMVANTDKMLPDSDWSKLRSLLSEWQFSIQDIITLVANAKEKRAAELVAARDAEAAKTTASESDGQRDNTSATPTELAESVESDGSADAATDDGAGPEVAVVVEPSSDDAIEGAATPEPPTEKVTEKRTAGKEPIIDEGKTDPSQLILEVKTWILSSMNRIEIEDRRIVEEVSDLHSLHIVKWIVDLLLELTRTKEEKDERRRERREKKILEGEVHAVELGKENVRDDDEKEENEKMLSSLRIRCQLLTSQVQEFTSLLFRCCSDVIQARFAVTKEFKDIDEDEDYKDLKLLQGENEEWKSSSAMLLSEVDAVLKGLPPASAVSSATDIAAGKQSTQPPAPDQSGAAATAPPTSQDTADTSRLTVPGGVQPPPRTALGVSDAASAAVGGTEPSVTTAASDDVDQEPAGVDVPVTGETVINVLGADDNVHQRTLSSLAPASMHVRSKPMTALEADATLPRSAFGVESDTYTGAVKDLAERVNELEVQYQTAEQRAQAAESEVEQLRQQVEALQRQQEASLQSQRRTPGSRRR